MRTIHEKPFPFEILQRLTSREDAMRKGIVSSRVWAVVEGDGETCYAPPHITDGVSYYAVTAEQHDCGTYYLVTEDQDDAQ